MGQANVTQGLTDTDRLSDTDLVKLDPRCTSGEDSRCIGSSTSVSY